MSDGRQPLPAEQPQPRPSRRREKPQLSCTLCRRRKLRCDRGEPCGTCVRRGLETSCVYVRNSGQGTVNSSQPVVNSMTDRINELERLVTSLVESNRSPGVPNHDRISPVRPMISLSPGRPAVADASQPQDSRKWGRMQVEDNETTYVPSTHWTVILDEISDLKDMLANECRRTEHSTSGASVSSSEAIEPDFLFGSHKAANDRREILAAMPPKPMVDRLVAGYFLDRPIVPIVLHGPTFLSEYERFWENPMDTSIVWIGLLFAVMCLVVSYRPEIVPMMSESAAISRAYREKIVQCLQLGKYTKGVAYSIETLLLYLHIELLRSEDTQMEQWMMLGVTVRLAFRMGYHRDASHFRHISPFEGEMRRRIWSLVVQLDILTSAQVGMPRMVHDDQADTAEPRNLLDEDLHHDMDELPPTNPAAVQTEVQYTLSEGKLVLIYGRITDWTRVLDSRRTNLPTVEVDVARLSKQLDDTYAALPEALRMRPMIKSLVDNADTILRRITLFLHLQEAKCLLYYRFFLLLPSLLPDQQNSSHYRSARSNYIQAALKILECQQILFEETQISGRLHKDRWKVSSLLRQPCLMATALLCSELEDDNGSSLFSTSAEESRVATMDSSNSMNNQNVDANSLIYDIRSEIIQALHNCCLVWTHLSDNSRNALKAAEAVRVVLNKMQNTNANPPSMMDNASVLEVNMSNPMTIPGNSSVSENPSRVLDLLEQTSDRQIPNMQHNGPAHTANDLSHHSDLSDESQMEYDPLSPGRLNMQQGLDHPSRVTRWFPKRFPFPI